MGVHLYRINVEFPAAVWSVVVSLSDPPKVGDSIDVKGTPCIVLDVEPPPGVRSPTRSIAANVHASPSGESAARPRSS